MWSRPPTRSRIRAFFGRCGLVTEQLGEQPSRGLLDQIERMIEALGLAEEGIGHVLGPGMRGEIEEAADLVALTLGRDLLEILVIRAVHGEQ